MLKMERQVQTVKIGQFPYIVSFVESKLFLEAFLASTHDIFPGVGERKGDEKILDKKVGTGNNKQRPQHPPYHRNRTCSLATALVQPEHAESGAPAPFKDSVRNIKASVQFHNFTKFPGNVGASRK